MVCGDLWLLPSLVNIGDTGTRERAPTSLSVCLSVWGTPQTDVFQQSPPAGASRQAPNCS